MTYKALGDFELYTQDGIVDVTTGDLIVVDEKRIVVYTPTKHLSAQQIVRFATNEV